MLFKLLLVLQALVAATMIGLILMQKSEGGGLGVGGSPSGMLSARGAADFLTRATTFCAILFVGFSIALAGLASTAGNGKVNAEAAKKVAPVAAPASAVPMDAGSATGGVPIDPENPLGAAAGQANAKNGGNAKSADAAKNEAAAKAALGTAPAASDKNIPIEQ
jgi:preprotein translocase subunit SecG